MQFSLWNKNHASDLPFTTEGLSPQTQMETASDWLRTGHLADEQRIPHGGLKYLILQQDEQDMRKKKCTQRKENKEAALLDQLNVW